MSMRDILLGLRLDFSTPEQRRVSEDLLLRISGLMARANLLWLQLNPDTPLLYESDVVYAPPDQTTRPALDPAKLRKLLKLLREMGQEPETALQIVRLLRGVEVFLDWPTLLRRGKGDCNELVPVRLAELWRAGIMATTYLTCEPKEDGGYAYHNIILHADGSTEDPSLILGMGGPTYSAQRREECHANFVRLGRYIDAAQRLVASGDVPSSVVGWGASAAGFVPRSGVFRSPYGRCTDTSDVGGLARFSQERFASHMPLMLRAA